MVTEMERNIVLTKTNEMNVRDYQLGFTKVIAGLLLSGLTLACASPATRAAEPGQTILATWVMTRGQARAGDILANSPDRESADTQRRANEALLAGMNPEPYFIAVHIDPKEFVRLRYRIECCPSNRGSACTEEADFVARTAQRPASALYYADTVSWAFALENKATVATEEVDPADVFDPRPRAADGSDVIVFGPFDELPDSLTLTQYGPASPERASRCPSVLTTSPVPIGGAW